jgi:hypothetical protein
MVHLEEVVGCLKCWRGQTGQRGQRGQRDTDGKGNYKPHDPGNLVMVHRHNTDMQAAVWSHNRKQSRLNTGIQVEMVKSCIILYCNILLHITY